MPLSQAPTDQADLGPPTVSLPSHKQGKFLAFNSFTILNYKINIHLLLKKKKTRLLK